MCVLTHSFWYIETKIVKRHLFLHLGGRERCTCGHILTRLSQYADEFVIHARGTNICVLVRTRATLWSEGRPLGDDLFPPSPACSCSAIALIDHRVGGRGSPTRMIELLYHYNFLTEVQDFILTSLKPVSFDAEYSSEQRLLENCFEI